MSTNMAQFESIQQSNKLGILRNNSLKIAKTEQDPIQTEDYKMVKLKMITRDQLGEIIPVESSAKNQATDEQKPIPLIKTDDKRYCAYCGSECPYNPTYRKYKMNCYQCSHANYLPALYCNICGRKGQGMLIYYMDICCDPKVTGSDCYEYSKENPYN